VIFQRLHNKERIFRTGMGLAVAKEYENQEEKIWVESIEGQGKYFLFYNK
jgi:light-regulated signal transduction histidine kinase (bacteriophytochrome)